MGSSKKIADGVFWSTVVNVVNGIYGFISVPILIAYFGKSDYGLIGLALSVNVYLRLMDLGLTSTNVRFFSNWIAKKEFDSVRKLFGTSLSFYGCVGLLNALILVIVSFFCADIFQLEEGQEQTLQNLLYILAISAFVSWFSSCFDQLVMANECVGWKQRITLLPKAFQILVLGLTVWCKFGIELYYALTTFAFFLSIPFVVSKIKKVSPYVSFIPHFDKATFKIILPYCLNIFSFGIFQFSVNNLRPVFLGMQDSVASVADYRILNGIIQIVLMIGGTFLGVALPSASKAVATHNQAAQDKVAYRGTKYVTIILAFCCFGMISVSKDVLSLYVGESYLYLTGWLVLWLLTTLMGHNQAISSLILAGADIRAITYNTAISAIIGLIVCWFTIPSWHIGGTIVGYGVYGLCQIVFYYVYYWPRKMGIDSKRVFTQSFLPYAVMGAILAAALFYVELPFNHLLSFIVKGISFAIVYLIATWALMDKEDKSFIFSLVKKG